LSYASGVDRAVKFPNIPLRMIRARGVFQCL